MSEAKRSRARPAQEAEDVHDVQTELDIESDEVQEGESEKDAGDRIIDKYRAQATSPTKAIRAMCVYCMNGQPREVAKCTAPNCPLFPFRMGFNPYHGRAKNPISK
jgi:hypothetical protein